MAAKVHHLKSGAVIHQPSATTENRFSMLGVVLINEIDQMEPYTLWFSLAQQSDVEPTVEMLPRIERADAIWFEGDRKGILHLHLRKSESRKQTNGGSANGGNVRALRVQDLVASLERVEAIDQAPTLNLAPSPDERSNFGDRVGQLGHDLDADSAS